VRERYEEKGMAVSMKRSELFKHSLLLALTNTAYDFDEYYLYFMLPLGYGCNNINFVFASLTLVKCVSSFVDNVVCGYIVDATESHQHIALWSCSSWVFTSAVALMYFGTFVSVPSLCFFFVLHLFAVILIDALLWKVIKMRAQVSYLVFVVYILDT